MKTDQKIRCYPPDPLNPLEILVTDQKSPSMILMKGHPATGKSTLARALGRQLGWPVLDKDDAKDHTDGLLDDDQRNNQLAYDILWQVVETQLAIGLNVIVESPLAHPWLYECGKSLAQRYHRPLLVVETRLDEATWRQRLDARSAARTRPHTPNSWDEMQAQLVRYNGSWRYPIDPAHHIVVDTAQPLDECVTRVVARWENAIAE